MQYILTEEEFKDLIEGVKNCEKKNEALIQKLCTEVANHKPIKFWGHDEAEVWGCCQHGDAEDMGYCDECPVQDDCPEKHKRWSK